MHWTTMLDLIKVATYSHSQHPIRPSKAFRKWDKKTPFAIHPIWCSMTILTETKLSEQIRELGWQVLLLHDVLEDTKENLSDIYDPEVIRLVKEMSFEGGSTQEMEEIWDKEDIVILFKLYDKVSNILDPFWDANPDYFEKYKLYTLKLAQYVKEEYGLLNIVKMAYAIC